MPEASLADWVSAVATSVAAGAAIAAAFGTIRAFKATRQQIAFVERVRREDVAAARESSERDQASKVVFWVGDFSDIPPGARYGSLSTIMLHVRNGSDLPVYNVRVLPSPANFRFWQSLGPTSTVLGGNESDAKALILTFRDARGRWWQRTFDGDLQPLVEPPDVHWVNEIFDGIARPEGSTAAVRTADNDAKGA